MKKTNTAAAQAPLPCCQEKTVFRNVGKPQAQSEMVAPEVVLGPGEFLTNQVVGMGSNFGRPGDEEFWFQWMVGCQGGDQFAERDPAGEWKRITAGPFQDTIRKGDIVRIFGRPEDILVHHFQHIDGIGMHRIVDQYGTAYELHLVRCIVRREEDHQKGVRVLGDQIIAALFGMNEQNIHQLSDALKKKGAHATEAEIREALARLIQNETVQIVAGKVPGVDHYITVI